MKRIAKFYKVSREQFFDGWRDTPAGRKDIRRALRSVVWVKFGCREKELFDRIYRCVELYG